MPWVRIDDAAMTHPKVIGLSDKAFRLWVWGLAYCQQHLTDGYIPLAAIKAASVLRVASQLVQARLWDVREAGGWDVHDYTDWNDSREEVNDKRTRARERMRGVRANFVKRTSTEVPIRLGSDPGSLIVKEEKKDFLQERFEAFWAAYPRKIGKGDAWTAWRKLRPDSDLSERILASIAAHLHDSQWQKERGQFIPHPSRFLNDRRFEDELTPQPQVSEATSRLAQAVRDFNESS